MSAKYNYQKTAINNLIGKYLSPYNWLTGHFFILFLILYSLNQVAAHF